FHKHPCTFSQELHSGAIKFKFLMHQSGLKAIPYTQLQFQLTTQISEYKLSKAQKLAYECVRKKYKGC
ncbi:MAG: hypothetical protein QF493_13290, partial [Rhodospirillales bacterium]|nr:hypothetical protein [Rhodospirillales bacterium]